MIARAGRPLVRLTVVDVAEKPRDLSQGYWAGRVRIADDFDGPLPEDVLLTFEAEEA